MINRIIKIIINCYTELQCGIYYHSFGLIVAYSPLLLLFNTYSAE